MTYALLTLALWIELVGMPISALGAAFDGNWKACAVICAVFPIAFIITACWRELDYEQWLGRSR